MTERILILVGRSGAGRSTALAVLEDMGFESINNLPVALIPRVLKLPNPPAFLALGVDVWSRDFSSQALLKAYEQLKSDKKARVQLIFFDATDEVLTKRYSQSRRRHPMRSAIAPQEGMLREQDVLNDLRLAADLVLDTSNMSPHDLKASLNEKFLVGSDAAMRLTVQSFSYMRGLPLNADMVIDCRFLKNPHWEPSLRAHTGQDPKVGAYIMQDQDYGAFEHSVMSYLETFLPRHQQEGKAYFSIAFGCTGGKHRSVFMAQRVAELLTQANWEAAVRHRELTPEAAHA